MSTGQSFRLSWDTQNAADGSLQSIIHVTETICTPFSLRQFEFLGLLPPIDSHPRVLDNACGSGRQTEVLREEYEHRGLPIDITSCDIGPGMIDVLRRRIDTGNWKNVKSHVVNAEVCHPFREIVYLMIGTGFPC
jgi:SAM-dependent methyltransferase